MAEPAPEQTPGAAASDAPGFDPNRVFHANHFRLEIQNVGTAQFVEIGNLAVSVATIPFRAGGEGQVVHQLPGQVELAPLVCRYGVTSSPSLWQWMQSSMRGQVVRRNVSVLYLDADGVTELKRYNLTEAWPCQWNAAELHSLENQVAIESLSITFETIDRV
jgi:phage tail-like protein